MRGEITVVVGGAVAGPADPEVAVALVLSRVAGGERLKDAVAGVAESTGLVKRDLYAAALAARPPKPAP